MDSKLASRKLGYGFSSQHQEIPLSDFVVNAKKELEGCIAPVSYHTGIGKGNSSRKAFHKLTSLVLPALAKNTHVQLRITSSLSYFKNQHFT